MKQQRSNKMITRFSSILNKNSVHHISFDMNNKNVILRWLRKGQIKSTSAFGRSVLYSIAKKDSDLDAIGALPLVSKDDQIWQHLADLV